MKAHILKGFAKSLEMNDFSLTKEAKRIDHIRIVGQIDQSLISAPGLLFCCHVFIDIGNRIALRLEVGGCKGNAAGVGRIDGLSVLRLVRRQSGGDDLIDSRILY